MTTSNTAMTNVSKIQTTTKSGSKVSPDPKESAHQFDALFSSAQVQMSPNAQLNNIESQLRESLFKQDSKQGKKYPESNINAEAAQSTLWAQRDWMQNSSVADDSQVATDNKPNEASPTESSPESAQASNSTGSENNQTNATKPGEKPADNTPVYDRQANAKQSTENAPAEDQQNTEAAATSSNIAATDAQVVKVASYSANDLAADKLGAPAKPTTEQNITTTANSTPANTTNQTEILLENTVQASDESTVSITESTRLADKSNSGNPKVDAVLNNSTVAIRTESTSASVNNFTNANVVAAQLAPQIAKQTQNTGEQIELQDIKAGQKLMAGNSLQSSAIPTVIAAGTNGLSGTLGTAPHALIKTPITQPAFAKEIGQTVQWAIGKNLSTVEIRVNPEAFGPINMRLVQKGQQVQLMIRTQDEASSNILTQALSGLKEVLSQQGIQLNHVQIQHSNTPTTNTQANNTQSQFDQNNNQGQSKQQSAQGGNNRQEEAQLPATAPATKTQGKLDLFA